MVSDLLFFCSRLAFENTFFRNTLQIKRMVPETLV